MARDLLKILGTYIEFGLGAIGPVLNGAAKISVHAVVTGDTFSSASANDNRIFGVIIDGVNTTGLTLCVDNLTSIGNPVLRLGARSQAADGFQATNGTTVLAAGTSYIVGGVVDISGDAIRVYVNGVQETSTAVTFGAASYTHGTPSSKVDSVSDSASAFLCWDGSVAELAMWVSDIGSNGFAILGQRYDPRVVDFENMVFYCPLLGVQDPEPELISRKSGTIVVAAASLPHPAVIRRGSSDTSFASAAAAAAATGRGRELITVPFLHQGHWTGARV